MSDKNKTEPKTEAQILAEAIEQVAAKLIPAAVAAAVTANQAASQPRQAAPVQARRGGVCQVCRQRDGACGGKHVEMVVFPEAHDEYFQGVFLNGVKYLSNDPGHKVLVPADSESDIKRIVAGYVQNERELSQSRKAERHSGVVSPYGTAVTQQHVGWR